MNGSTEQIQKHHIYDEVENLRGERDHFYRKIIDIQQEIDNLQSHEYAEWLMRLHRLYGVMHSETETTLRALKRIYPQWVTEEAK